MRAIVVDHWTKPRDLKVQQIAEPELRPGAVEVEVKAAGCNFFDILIVRGQYQVKPPFPFVPGSELAGIVRAVGEGVEDFAPEDQVYGGVPLGAFAERAVVPGLMLRSLPRGMSFEEAAGLPIVYPTSYVGLVQRTSLQPGETLLVHAAAGGVGIAAVQIGKALGAHVIATAGGSKKLEVARQAGADLVIGHHPHVLQPWERVGDALILYSLGNFVFDLDADDLVTLGAGPFLTAVALIHLSPDAAPTLEVRPAFIDPLENRPRPASVQEAAAVRARLSELVEELVEER